MEKAKRYLVFLLGLFVNSLAVSIITKASLGTSPISSIPYVLSLNFPFTLGNFTIFFSVFLIVLQLFILRKNFKLEHLLQIPISVAFGYFIDATMLLLGWLDPQQYWVKIVTLLVGCLILGIGVYMEVLANVAMLPGESFVRAVSSTWDFEFGTVKIIFDTSMVVIAAVLSFILSHQLLGVREGTVIAALLVGFIARKVGMLCNGLEEKLFPQTTKQKEIAETKQNQAGPVIAIGRQFGCGGRAIGKALADRMGYAFYDRDIIRMAAGTAGYSTEFVEKNEEKMTGSLLFDLVNQMYACAPEERAPKDKIYEAEKQVILELAEKGNCVIVGRMADYILKQRKNCVSVFLYTSMAQRIKNVMAKDKISEKEAQNLIHVKEKQRAQNYRYYTNQVWGFAGNYDVSMDSQMGVDAIADVIRQVLKHKGEKYAG